VVRRRVDHSFRNTAVESTASNNNVKKKCADQGYRKGHENEGENERGLWDDLEQDGSPSCWKKSREGETINWRFFVH
jgi:hypothetical protein